MSGTTYGGTGILYSQLHPQAVLIYHGLDVNLRTN